MREMGLLEEESLAGGGGTIIRGLAVVDARMLLAFLEACRGL